MKIISRIKQGLIFIFLKYNKKNDKIVKNILSLKEFCIFDNMSEYDKIHCFKLFELCKENRILKEDRNYLKLALLHDCGKENYSLFRRVKKVLIGDKKLGRHSIVGYEKLKNINLILAKLIYNHHKKNSEQKNENFSRIGR